MHPPRKTFHIQPYYTDQDVSSLFRNGVLLFDTFTVVVSQPSRNPHRAASR